MVRTGFLRITNYSEELLVHTTSVPPPSFCGRALEAWSTRRRHDIVTGALIRRFSLYSFLKNQRYFEAYFLLAMLAKGLGFAEIGLLVACREIVVNLCEVPSGAIADASASRAASGFPSPRRSGCSFASL